MNINTKELTVTALLTALICAVSPFSIPLPFSPVPVTLSVLIILITVYLVGTKKALLACLIYVFLGSAGLPVFSGFTGGIAKTFGPTGGYILGYFSMILISGLFIDKSKNRFIQFVGMVLGIASCYLIGTMWLKFSIETTFINALWMGVIPFIPADLVKIVTALIIGPIIKTRLSKLNLIEE